MLTNSLHGAIAQHRAASPSPPGCDLVISVRGLTKRYGDHEAVRGIDLEVPAARSSPSSAPMGPARRRRSRSSRASARRAAARRVLGADPGTRPHLAGPARIVLQDSGTEPGLTVGECLHLYAGYYRAPRNVEETLALVGLDEQVDELLARYRVASGGA